MVVQLLPQAMWRTKTGKLAESAKNIDDIMATGVVVGVLSRKDREYVASFDVRVCVCVCVCLERETHYKSGCVSCVCMFYRR